MADFMHLKIIKKYLRYILSTKHVGFAWKLYYLVGVSWLPALHQVCSLVHQACAASGKWGESADPDCGEQWRGDSLLRGIEGGSELLGKLIYWESTWSLCSL